MDFRAIHRYARISPSKVKPIVNMVRRKSVNDALINLKTTNRRGAGMVAKVIQAALAGARLAIAEHRLDLDANDLIVFEARVDGGPSIKRWKPVARGMAAPILKRMSHIRITLRPPEEA